MDRYPKSRWRAPYPVHQGGRYSRRLKQSTAEAIVVGACVVALLLAGIAAADWLATPGSPLQFTGPATDAPREQAQILPTEPATPPPSRSDEADEFGIEVVRPASRRAMSEYVYYRNCDAARAAGAAPIARGMPGYRDALDRDNDGWACEPYPR